MSDSTLSCRTVDKLSCRQSVASTWVLSSANSACSSILALPCSRSMFKVFTTWWLIVTGVKWTTEDPLQLDDIDMTSEWVEEVENSSPTQWLDRFGSDLDRNELNTPQFTAVIFGAIDHIFGL
ncbi:hypothetical protein BC332_15521 [Capsicum chinense]|nr:hypothetical protein BC332_15521 [Capsicum chinense]